MSLVPVPSVYKKGCSAEQSIRNEHIPRGCLSALGSGPLEAHSKLCPLVEELFAHSSLYYSLIAVKTARPE